MVVNHLMFADDICVFGLSISGLQCSLMQNRRQKSFNRQARGGRLGLAPPLKYTKVTLFTIILYNSENKIRE